MYFLRFFSLFISLFTLSLTAIADGSLAVLMYHNVSDKTPRSTSVTLDELKAHITWLKENNFLILSLDDALQGIEEKRFTEQDYIAAISFDDSHHSVCDTAWPYLKSKSIPFTFFINSDPIEKRYPSQCTIEQLKEMAKSNLVTIGNHGKSHMHMANSFNYETKEAWRKAYQKEVIEGESFIQEQLGIQPKYFAYPYGEFNQEIKNFLKKRGYIAFGQNSGAIGKSSDHLALPRFAAAGQYADLSSLASKLKSLAFPAEMTISSDNPIAVKSSSNPPMLTLDLNKTPYGTVNCFLADGTAIPVKKKAKSLTVQAETPLTSGRQRYNCTASSGKNGRFHWLSQQWLLY